MIARLLAPPPGARLLDLGCGHGRHAIELSRAGHRTIGLDLDLASLALLATGARAARVSVPALRADLGALPLAEGCLDGAYAWYSSLFLFDDTTHAEVLARLARALRPSASLVHQGIHPEWIAAQGPARIDAPLRRGGRVTEESRFDAASGRDEGLRRAELPGGRVLEARFSILYPPPEELARMLRGAGFSRVELLDGPAVDLAPGVLLARAVR